MSELNNTLGKSPSLEEILAEAKAKKINDNGKQNNTKGKTPDLMESLSDTPPDIDTLSVYIKFGQADKSIDEITKEIKSDIEKASTAKKAIVRESKDSDEIHQDEEPQSKSADNKHPSKRNGGFFENRMKTGYFDDDVIETPEKTDEIKEIENPTLAEKQGIQPFESELHKKMNTSFNTSDAIAEKIGGKGLGLSRANVTNQGNPIIPQNFEKQGKKLFDRATDYIARDEAPTLNYQTSQTNQDRQILAEEHTQQDNTKNGDSELKEEKADLMSFDFKDYEDMDSTTQRRKNRLEEFFSVDNTLSKKEQKIADQTTKISDEMIDIADEASVEENVYALSSKAKKAVVHFICMAIITIISLVINLAPVIEINIFDAVNPTINPESFLIINFAVLILGALISLKTLARGIMSAFSFSNDTDGLLGVFSLFIITHSAFILTNPYVYLIQERLPVLAPILLIALTINSAGKFVCAKRMRKNYKLVSSDYEKYCADIVDSDTVTTHLNRLSTYPEAVSVASVKAQTLSGYFVFSESDEPSGVFNKIAAPILMCLALILGLFIFFSTQNLLIAFTSMTLLITLTCPLTSCFSGSILLYKLSCRLFKKGAVVTGYEAAHNLSEANGVIVDAKELFPSGTISLHGVKTFSSERIDEAIINIASVVYAAKGTYSNMFLEVIEGKTNILKTVDSYIYEDGMGVSAWIGSQRILVGNRQLLANHGVDVPSKDYEDRYLKESMELIYLAVAGTLGAMFIIKYTPDNEIKHYLEKIQKAGFDIFIKTNDSNITAEKIANVYAIDKEILKIIPGSAYPDLDKAMATKKTAYAKAVHTGSFPAFASTVFGSAKLNSAMRFSVALQIISVCFCGILGTILCITNTVSQLNLPILLGIELFWAMLITICPLLGDM